MTSFNSSPNFYGINNVPAGLHFVYTGSDASLAIRHGRWLNIADVPNAIQVFKWSSEEEALVLLSADSSDHRSALSALPTLRERGLIDYAHLQDASALAQAKDTTSLTSPPTDWLELTSHITPQTLNRLIPSHTLTSVSSSPLDTESIPGLTSLEAASALPTSSNLNLLPINLKQTWSSTAIGRDRTDMARDRSWYLRHLMDSLHATRQDGAKEILGELQFCFTMVLILMNWSCLEGWKRILAVLFTCKEALGEVEGYFVEVLKVLRLQLEHVDDVEGGLFDLRDEVGSRWLRRLVEGFRGNVEDRCELGSELRVQMEEFEEFVKERYGWESGRDVLRRGVVELEDGERLEVSLDGADEDDERGEYAPVVIET